MFPALSGRHLVAVLHLEVPPTSLDVNLDPSKTSVLLSDIVRLLTNNLQYKLQEKKEKIKIVLSLTRCLSLSLVLSRTVCVQLLHHCSPNSIPHLK